MRRFFDVREKCVFFYIKRIGGIHIIIDCDMPP